MSRRIAPRIETPTSDSSSSRNITGPISPSVEFVVKMTFRANPKRVASLRPLAMEGYSGFSYHIVPATGTGASDSCAHKPHLPAGTENALTEGGALLTGAEHIGRECFGFICW